MKTLADVRPVTATLPPRLLIHGCEGVGKTTLAAGFPKPVFLQTEDGTPGKLELASFGLLEDLNSVREAITALGNEANSFRTLVLDSLDALQPMIWAAVCREHSWASIETPGYGRGYVETDAAWCDLLAGFDWLRRTRGMTIVLIAHSAVETINDPRVPAYTSYQLRVHKRARALLQDWADAIGFLAVDLAVKSEDVGFGRKRVRADGGSLRYLHFEARPAFTAKSRYALPAKLPIPRDFDTAKLAPLFPPAAPEGTVPLRAAGGLKHEQ
jgi:AAA domain